VTSHPSLNERVGGGGREKTFLLWLEWGKVAVKPVKRLGGGFGLLKRAVGRAKDRGCCGAQAFRCVQVEGRIGV